MARWRLHPSHRPPRVGPSGARHHGTDSFARAAHGLGSWSPFSRYARLGRYRKIPWTTPDDGEKLLDQVKVVDGTRRVEVEGEEKGDGEGKVDGDGKREGLVGRIWVQIGKACCSGVISL